MWLNVLFVEPMIQMMLNIINFVKKRKLSSNVNSSMAVFHTSLSYTQIFQILINKFLPLNLRSNQIRLSRGLETLSDYSFTYVCTQLRFQAYCTLLFTVVDWPWLLTVPVYVTRCESATSSNSLSGFLEKYSLMHSFRINVLFFFNFQHIYSCFISWNK